jgi:hypothetical protein
MLLPPYPLPLQLQCLLHQLAKSLHPVAVQQLLHLPLLVPVAACLSVGEKLLLWPPPCCNASPCGRCYSRCCILSAKSFWLPISSSTSRPAMV